MLTTAISRRFRSREFIGLSRFVRSYHENIIDHYENPRNVGSMDKNKQSVGKFNCAQAPEVFCKLTSACCICLIIGTGLVGAPACGDVMKLQIDVNDDGTIKKAVFKTFGCGSAIGALYFIHELLWLLDFCCDRCTS